MNGRINDQILTQREVEEITGLSRTTIWREQKTGRFPKRRRASSGRIGWLRSDIERWMNHLPLVGRGGPFRPSLSSDIPTSGHYQNTISKNF